MKVVISLLLSIFASSCVSSSVTRGPSNSEVAAENIENVKSFLKQQIENYARNEFNQKYQIINIPFMGPGDVSNGAELIETVMAFFKDYQTVLSDIAVMANNGTLKGFVFSNFSTDERMTLLNICFSNKFRKGKLINPIAFGLMSFCSPTNKNILLTQEQLAVALTEFPKSPQRVKYLGGEGDMQYTDHKLEEMVRIIVYYLLTDKTEFREVFFNLDKNTKNKFLLNNYLSQEQSKIEPFDLLLHSLTEQFNAINMGHFREVSQPIDFIALKRLAKKALAQTLLVSNKSDIYAWQSPDVSIIKNKENFILLCANGIFQTNSRFKGGDSRWKKLSESTSVEISPTFQNTDFPSSILEKWTLQNKLIDLLNNDLLKFKFRCGVTTYDISLKKTEVAAIPKPQPFHLENEAHAIMTIALTQEVGDKERNVLSKYLRYMEGWSLEKDYELVDTKEKFEELFNKADIYIPVSHAMDVNYFLVGTEKANYLTLSKTFSGENGERKIYLHLLLPSQGNIHTNTLTYNVTDLSKLYSRRRKAKGTPLFLMNLSCGSEGTLATWTLVYRDSVDQDMKNNPKLNFNDFTDLPYLIGSNRNFSTNSTGDLATHINFPIESIKILAENGKVRDVVSFLDKPNSKGFVGKIVGLVSGINKEAAENESFSPVFNLDIPELMTYGGYSLNLEQKKYGIKQTY